MLYAAAIKYEAKVTLAQIACLSRFHAHASINTFAHAHTEYRVDDYQHK